MEIAGIIIAFILMSKAKKLTNSPLQANYNGTKGLRIAELVISILNIVNAVTMGICSIVFAFAAFSINSRGEDISYYIESEFGDFSELGMDAATVFNIGAVAIYISTALFLFAAIIGFVSVGKAGKAMSAYAANSVVPANTVQTYAQPTQYAQTPAQPYQAPVQQAPAAPAPAPAPASKFCTTCGNVLDSGAKFCPRCGSAQE